MEMKNTGFMRLKEPYWCPSHNWLKTVLTKKISGDIPEHPEKKDITSFQEMMLINPKEQKL